MRGRFAPSPTGPLHLGNVRTALIAWLAARSVGGSFIVRIEDLDRVTASIEHERAQLGTLAALGLDWDGDVVRQSERFHLYRDALATLRAAGVLYDCYCTRREIRDEIDRAVSAPHQPVGRAPDAYPGTCRHLTDGQRAAKRATGRPPAVRLRGDDESVSFVDVIAGRWTGVVDDVVVQRNDGVPAYNLAVVVDDADQGVTQVVRGDDLLTSTPRQIRIGRLLGLPIPEFAHVPLVLHADGRRLSKRDGVDEHRPGDVVGALAASLGFPSAAVASDLLAEFRLDRVPRRPWVLPHSAS